MGPLAAKFHRRCPNPLYEWKINELHNYLTPESSVLFLNLAVPHIVKILLVFYGTASCWTPSAASSD